MKKKDALQVIEIIETALKTAGAPATPYVFITDEMTQEEQEFEILAGLLKEGLPLSEAEEKAKQWLAEAMLHRPGATA